MPAALPNPFEPDPSLAAARSALGRLQDLDRRVLEQGQGGWQLVCSRSGERYLIPLALTSFQPDCAKSDTITPQSSLAGLAVPPALVEARVRAAVSTLDSHPASVMPLVEFAMPDGNGVYRGPGIYAGLEPQHPFQVTHLGGNEWHVAGGEVVYPRRGERDDTWTSVRLAVPSAQVSIAKGWICLPMTFHVDTPYIRGGGSTMPQPGYDITLGATAAREELVVQGVTQSISVRVDDLGINYVSTVNFTAGHRDHPLAWVAAPGEMPETPYPYICQTAAGIIAFMGVVWNRNFPNSF